MIVCCIIYKTMNHLLSIIASAVLTLGSFFGIHPQQAPTPVEAPRVGSFNPTGGGTYRLQSSIGSSDTTITLSSFKEPVSNIYYTMTYLNSSIEYATIEPQTSTKEFISFTGITQNSDGTATLTGVTRGLGFSYPYTASTTLQQAHPANAIFILSNPPQLTNQYANKNNDETISGAWTIGEPTAASGIATKNYVDTHVNGGTVSTDSVKVAGTAGETFATGTPVYLAKSDGLWYKAGTNISGAYDFSLIGIAQGAGSAAASISGGVLISGLDTTQVAMTTGNNIFVSSTPGATTTATTSIALGRARSSTGLYVDTHIGSAYLHRPNTFTATTTIAATSSLTIGSFSAYQIGKNSQIFGTTTTGTSTFAIPSGITKLFVEVMGAGAGGRGCTGAGSGCRSNGGGGGGYANEVVDVTGTSSVQVFVGTGGASSAAGTWSTFGTNGFFLSAAGAPSQVPGCASGGDINICGFNGGTAITPATLAGNAGSAFYGGTREGNEAGTGFDGIGIGAGGSGCGATGSNTCTGGVGANGAVIIRW